MEASEAIDIIKSIVRQHPRWDPLRREPAKEQKEFTLNGVPFTISLSDTGLSIFVHFAEEIALRSIDGLNTMDDTPGDPQKIITQFMPTLNLSDIPKMTAFPYPSVSRYLVFHLPSKRFDVFLYDMNWIWNSFIPEVFSYGQEDEGGGQNLIGAHFFNIWATFGNDDDETTRYPGVAISLVKSKIAFNVSVPKGFRNISRCRFYLQGSGRNVVNIGDLNIKDMKGMVANKMWIAVAQDKSLLMYDEESNFVVVSIPQSNVIKNYILETFQQYIWPNETKIRTIASGEGKLRIVPFDFCSNVADAIDTVMQVVFQDDKKRVRFSPIYGFELMEKPWGVGTIARLPIVPLQRQVMIGIMKQLQALESIPMRERTTANWEEMEKLTKVIRSASAMMNIEACALCSKPATIRAKANDKLYCSQGCAKKQIKKK